MIFRALRYLGIAPLQLSIREKCISALACLTAIFLTAWLSRYGSPTQAPLLVASMGASAVILFAIPGSPLAQPWPFVGGQLLSGFVGILCARYIDDHLLALGLAAGASVLVMLSFRCLHPPGSATALIPILAGHSDFQYLLNPLGSNVLSLLLLALLINRLLLRRTYPTPLPSQQPISQRPPTAENRLIVCRSDIEQATGGMDQFVDVGPDQLAHIFTRLQLLYFERNRAALYCGAIMTTAIITVEYDTEVETAWLLMQQQHLKALPVLDRTRRVIGIVTRYDFLKHLKLTPYQSFQEKWQNFITRTPATSTNKPEAIGHIMTRKVKTLPVTAHIAELIPLVIHEGHHHIPIVDAEQRFVGMVFQSRLLAALFNQLVVAETL